MENTAKKFETDPFFVSSFIIQNNPDAVYRNLSGMGIAPKSNQPEAIYSTVEKLLKSKQGNHAIAALNVEYLPQNDPGGYNDFFQEYNVLDGQLKSITTTPETSTESGGSFWPSDLGEGVGIITELLDAFGPYIPTGKVTVGQPPVINESPNLMLWGGVIFVVVVIIVLIKLLK